MAKKPNITYKQLMAMKEADFLAFVEAGGYAAIVADIATRKTAQKVYPKVKMESKKHPGKFTMQADKTKEPVVKMKPITFFEVKCALAEEVLHLPKVEKKQKETFRDKLIAMGNAAN